MKVSELIAALQRLPDQIDVTFAECEHHHLDIDRVEHELIVNGNEEPHSAVLKSTAWTDDCECDGMTQPTPVINMARSGVRCQVCSHAYAVSSFGYPGRRVCTACGNTRWRVTHSESLMDNERMALVAERAMDAFWSAVASEYPEIVTGDASPEICVEIGNKARAWVSEWVHTNLPENPTPRKTTTDYEDDRWSIVDAFHAAMRVDRSDPDSDEAIDATTHAFDVATRIAGCDFESEKWLKESYKATPQEILALGLKKALEALK